MKQNIVDLMAGENPFQKVGNYFIIQLKCCVIPQEHSTAGPEGRRHQELSTIHCDDYMYIPESHVVHYTNVTLSTKDICIFENSVIHYLEANHL